MNPASHQLASCNLFKLLPRMIVCATHRVRMCWAVEHSDDILACISTSASVLRHGQGSCREFLTSAVPPQSCKNVISSSALSRKETPPKLSFQQIEKFHVLSRYTSTNPLLFHFTSTSAKFQTYLRHCVNPPCEQHWLSTVQCPF